MDVVELFALLAFKRILNQTGLINAWKVLLFMSTKEVLGGGLWDANKKIK